MGKSEKHASLAEVIFFCIATSCPLILLILFPDQHKTANVRRT
jgi:hypothetical protein